MQKSYYAIIPANIRYDKELTPNAKLLYGEITALCNEKGYCWASNFYFADLYGVSRTSISKWINQLLTKNYINSEIHYKGGTKEILHRYIRIVNDPMQEKLNTPMQEKLIDNNTLINNTNNNTFNNTSRHKFSTYDLEMSKLLFSLILENNEKAKQPDIHKWSDEFRLMRERDQRTEEQIKYLIQWSQADSFWKSNILSPTKLRKHFDQLIMRVKSDIQKQNVEKKKPRAFQSLADWADENE